MLRFYRNTKKWKHLLNLFNNRLKQILIKNQEQIRKMIKNQHSQDNHQRSNIVDFMVKFSREKDDPNVQAIMNMGMGWEKKKIK